MRRRRIPAVIAVLAVVAGLIAMSPPQPAEAASASDFSPGNLISDANFFDGTAMSTTQVQTFLNQRQAGCATGATCLNGYAQGTPSIAADRYCRAYQGVARETAASIIARVGQACNVSPRAMLVLLEKEQSLVTSRAPSSSQYTKATGFGCPDTAPCDASVGGFFYQVYYGARQFQRYAAHPENYNHRAGVVNRILYHPNAACGSSPVLIENQATAGLYNYTPYQPNAAAMRNLYGSGDTCSAYGNRNFWRIYTDWFGNPRGTGNSTPIGAVDASATTRGLEATVSGWAFDPDTTTPVRVHVYANDPYPQGRNVGTLVADQARSNIPGSTPGGGNRFGFSGTVTVPTGTSRLCLHALDATVVANTMIGCVDVTPRAGSPIGQFESLNAVATTGTLRGWAHDPDTVAPVRVHIYRGGELGVGRMVLALDANMPRPDVQAAVSTAGAAHGFEGKVEIPPGGDRFCAYALNVQGGENRLLGCRDVVPAPVNNPGTGSGGSEGSEVGGSGDLYFLNDRFTSEANIQFRFGREDDQVYFGDWDGDGRDTPMLRRGATFQYANANATGAPLQSFIYGRADDVVMVGDWNGDGRDTLAVRRGGQFHIRNVLANGAADEVIYYGRPTDNVLVGDWNGDGFDTFAVRRGAEYHVRNSMTSGPADLIVHYGRADDRVLVGDWDGDGRDSFAVRRQATYYIANEIRPGQADIVLIYGRAADVAFSGDWNGDGADTLGVRRIAPTQ
ncbi:hypothetical protein LG314_10050 [Agrococcus terreus]|uniref:hypothetical protein n=1 Tax=Agrococcus terreus TaxID=574649 RepID=UPI00384AE3F2